MDQPLEKCDNCLKMFPESKIATHFGYCRRNIKKCSECGQMYDINFQDEHEEQFHKKSPCPHCKNIFPASDLNKHIDLCPNKPKFCQYCQLNVPIGQYSTHLRACESRTKPCEKCKKPITNKEYFIHIATCEGIVEQPPKNYGQHIEEQRNKMRKQEPKREYGVREKKEQYKYERKQKPQIKKDIKISYSNPSEKKESKYGVKEEKPRFHKPSNQPAPTHIKPAKRDVVMPKQKANEYQVPKPKIPIKKEEPKKDWEKQYLNDIQFDQEEDFHYNPHDFEMNYQEPIRPQVIPKPEPPKQINPVPDVFDEDEQIQKAIYESMGQKFPGKTNVPKELQSQDLMSQSFYRDVDIEKQRALMEDIEKKKKH